MDDPVSHKDPFSPIEEHEKLRSTAIRPYNLHGKTWPTINSHFSLRLLSVFMSFRLQIFVASEFETIVEHGREKREEDQVNDFVSSYFVLMT